MRVTRNACIDAIKKRQSYRKRVVPENQDMQLSETVAGEDGPVQRIESVEIRQQVERALQQRSEPHRTIVICREIQDMTSGTIALMVDTSVFASGGLSWPIWIDPVW
jgi:DNA-directed RNA polymerase specialized sigma24 family protein